MNEYVHRGRRELGGSVEEAYVPQVHERWVEAEVDWGEAIFEIGGQRRKPVRDGRLPLARRLRDRVERPTQ
ncbi:MAG: hypothetical protein M3292_05210 [Actinomycetota bacterium]|nr:hypothetical protein [Actinomycetota bacterium]